MVSASAGLPPIVTAVATLTAAILGFCFSLWLNRVLPWISVVSIRESTLPGDTVQIGYDLSHQLGRSWFIEPLPEGTNDVDDLLSAFYQARQWNEWNRQSDQNLRFGLQQLQAASNDDQIIRALLTLAGDRGIIEAMQSGIGKGIIAIPEIHDVGIKKLSYIYDEFDGSFSFSTAGYAFGLGSHLDEYPLLKLRLGAVADLICTLKRDALLHLFEPLSTVIPEQLDIHKRIEEEAREILSRYTHWLCQAIIANFGATPFIVFPEHVVLAVKTAGTMRLPCRLFLKNEEGDYGPVTGVLVVLSGATVEIAAVSEPLQLKVPIAFEDS